ncbi:hypothetical protein EXIGLDRAFT_731796 [Exidia glandulosa HHB12029]|uniref:Uncharacterized protein n=1 Tax=Exidia glandulosa HHB12029 TaxID=1314781 RepID=A0A165BQT7_EXIGL|nr:hypothetical protein EXIGLDRAFT_731796 [Exidia glandulosa HHB12029]
MAALNPNRYAGPAEAGLLREDIAADEAIHPALIQRVARTQTALHDAEETLRAAQEAYESAQRIHAHATQLEKALVERVRVSRGLLHPIRRLPDELLAMIFRTFRRASGHSNAPFLVAAVCAHWRHVALATPRLWVVVDCTICLDRANAEEYWTTVIQAHLDRSASLPLSVTISYSGPRDNDIELSHGLFPLFSALYCRARTFSFDTSENVTRQLAECLQGHAPDLIELDVNDGDCPNIATTVLKLWTLYAPSLESLACSGSALSWIGGDIFPSVTDLKLWQETFLTAHLTDLFVRFPNLQELKLFAGNALTSPVPVINRAEQLQKLEFTLCPGPMDVTIAQSFQFPNLREAEISMQDGHEWEADIFSTFMRSALPNVTSLTLTSGVLAVQSGVVSGLKACISLEHLTLSSLFGVCCFDDDEDEIFTALAAADAHGRWLCPRLRILTIECCVPQDSFANTIAAVASARCANALTGSPRRLKKIDIRTRHETRIRISRPVPVDSRSLQERLDNILQT